MRIVSGKLKGRAFATPEGRTTRPTSDRAREAIFNVLAHADWGVELKGLRVMDLFAGPGALGLEALSRGAAHASFIERDPGALKTLQSNIARLEREADAAVISSDATNIASWRGDAAGLLLADAPYGSGEGLTVAARLAELGALAPGALVVIETEQGESHDETALANAGLALLDDRRYGRARLNFLRYEG